MAIKTRLERLEKRAVPTGADGWTVGIVGGVMPAPAHIDYRDCIADLAPLPDDLVTVGDQVITTAEWNALEGNKVLVVYTDEAEVKDVA